MARGFSSASSEFLDVNSAPLGAAPTVFSMACWFNVSDVTTYQTLICHADTNVANFAVLSVDATPSGTVGFLSREAAGSSATANTSTTATNDTWHHALGVHASITDRTAYLDGAGAGTSVTSMSLSGHDQLSIGRTGSVSNETYVNGNVAEVALWNVALTAADAASLAAGFSPLMVRPSGLVFYAPLIRDEDRDLRGGLSLTPH